MLPMSNLFFKVILQIFIFVRIVRGNYQIIQSKIKIFCLRNDGQGLTLLYIGQSNLLFGFENGLLFISMHRIIKI